MPARRERALIHPTPVATGWPGGVVTSGASVGGDDVEFGPQVHPTARLMVASGREPLAMGRHGLDGGAVSSNSL